MNKKSFQKTRLTLETVGDAIDVINANNRETRRAMQGVAIVGFDQFADCGRLNILDRLYRSAKLIGAHGKMQTFIEAHGNIKLENEGKKNAKFVKRNKKPATVLELADWWYNYEKPVVADADKPKRDAEKMVESLIKSLTTGIAEHRMTNDVQTQAVINYLKAYEGFNEVDHVAPETIVKTASK